MDTHPAPKTGLLRLRQIIGDPKANPPVPAIIPVSRSSFYAGIQTGIYPPPQKKIYGPRIAVFCAKKIWAVAEGRDWREID